MAIYEALEYYWENRVISLTIKIDTLSLIKMIRGQWKIPWELAERGDNIRMRSEQLNVNITHIFIESNNVAD